MWGFLSDKFGRIFMLGTSFVLTSVAMFTLYACVTTPGFFLPCLMIAGLCFGGVLGTFPSICADAFGVKHAALNFAVLFSAFSLAALLAPQVGAYFRNASLTDVTEYPKAFLVAGFVAIIGLVLTVIIVRKRQNGR